MGYKFIKTKDKDNRFDNVEILFEMGDDVVTLEDLLKNFESFLKGCGFSFDGEIDIVKEEE